MQADTSPQHRLGQKHRALSRTEDSQGVTLMGSLDWLLGIAKQGLFLFHPQIHMKYELVLLISNPELTWSPFVLE